MDNRERRAVLFSGLTNPASLKQLARDRGYEVLDETAAAPEATVVFVRGDAADAALFERARANRWTIMSENEFAVHLDKLGRDGSAEPPSQSVRIKEWEEMSTFERVAAGVLCVLFAYGSWLVIKWLFS